MVLIICACMPPLLRDSVVLDFFLQESTMVLMAILWVVAIWLFWKSKGWRWVRILCVLFLLPDTLYLAALLQVMHYLSHHGPH